MEFSIFRLTFDKGVHIGEGSLEDHGIILHADTIFSALCIEALNMGGEPHLNRLLTLAGGDTFFLSDAFPYAQGEYYVPKPVVKPRINLEDNDPSAKKVFKKMKYIPLDKLDDYFRGVINADAARDMADGLDEKLGKSSLVARAAVRTGDETLPYHVGIFTFRKGAGLYIITGGDEASLTILRGLFSGLAYSGVGGKRTSGLGRFTVVEEPVPNSIAERLTGTYPAYMTLCASMPNEAETETVMANITYTLLRRSGYVLSDTYADDPLRKKDFYLFNSGAVVSKKYIGGIFDVSNGGAHPVYRYAKPLFMGVTP